MCAVASLIVSSRTTGLATRIVILGAMRAALKPFFQRLQFHVTAADFRPRTMRIFFVSFCTGHTCREGPGGTPRPSVAPRAR